MAGSWASQPVLGVDQFDDGMLNSLFGTAAKMKALVKRRGCGSMLHGKVLANVFFEPSTRTMCSFEAAMKRLGGEVISVTEGSSSAKKGETIEDTIRCLQCYADVLVLRHPEKGTAARAAAVAAKPVINAGDGVGEHPTQALLDLFTISQVRGGRGLADVTLTLVGDLKHGRTVHSLSLLASHMKPPPKLRLVSPPSLGLPPAVFDELRARGVEAEVHTDLSAVLSSTDVLYVTRVQRERFDTPAEYEQVAGSYVIDRKAPAPPEPHAAALSSHHARQPGWTSEPAPRALCSAPPMPEVPRRCIRGDAAGDGCGAFAHGCAAPAAARGRDLARGGLRPARKVLRADGERDVRPHGLARARVGSRLGRAGAVT